MRMGIRVSPIVSSSAETQRLAGSCGAFFVIKILCIIRRPMKKGIAMYPQRASSLQEKEVDIMVWLWATFLVAVCVKLLARYL